MNYMWNNQSKTKLIAAVFLVIVGLLLLLKNLGFIEYILPGYLYSWKMFIVIIGVVMLVTKETKGPGLLLITFGVYLLLPDVFDVSRQQVNRWWPVLLILLGLYVIWQIFNNKENDKKPF